MAKRTVRGKTRSMLGRVAWHFLLLAAACAFASVARAETPARLRVDAPAADATTTGAWIEVRGQAAARELAAHDLVLVLDLSDSSLLPSGWDVDGDGTGGATDPALLAALEAKPDVPPSVLTRLRESDFDDTVLAATLVAARALLDRLDDRYRVGIVVFSDRARMVAPLGASRDALERAFEEIRTSFFRELRGTNFGDAIGAAQLVLQPETPGQPGGLPAGRDQSILLLSDGEPTLPPFGDRARQHALYAANAAAAAGIRIFPFELARAEKGRGVLAELADRTGGRLERLERPGDAIARLRRTDLAGLEVLRVVNETTGRAVRALRTFPDGSFDGFVELAPGANRLSFEARTTDGTRSRAERTVFRHADAADAAASERALLEELRRRTAETELWNRMEQQRRAPRQEMQLRVEPDAEPDR
jgi:hypothetical protein